MSEPAISSQRVDATLPEKRRGRRRFGWPAPMVPGMAFLIAISVYPTIYSLNASFYR